MIDILYYIALFSFVLLLIYLVAKEPFYHYQRKKKYTQILNTINKLYQDINPFEISTTHRIANNIADPDFHYGEISLCALLDLVAMIDPRPNDTFYDVGSGCGKSLLAIKLRYPQMQVIGIEALKPLHDIAVQKLAQMQDVILICDDLLNYHFLDPNIVFINSTSFSAKTWDQIVQKLIQLKAGTKIIVTSKTLPSPFFAKRYQGMERMSWGLTSTTIYEKIN